MTMNRRSLFKVTGAAAGAAALAGTAACSGADDKPSSLEDAENISGATTSSATPLAEKSPPASLTGRLVRPGDPDYLASSVGWDQLFTHYPMVIVFAQNTEDVVNALTWARQNDVALRVRSGRHNLEGWNSVDNGIVIDVSEIKGAVIDKEAGTAVLGAGLNQSEAITALGAQDFAAPTGTEGTVGLVGATLGGGFGLLSRPFGMASDNLIAAEIVVAAGVDGATALTVSETSEPDLLWALRGAGNGNFGVVTSLTYTIHPLPQATYVTATWPGLSNLQEVFDAWQTSAPTTDHRLTSQLEVHPDFILLSGALASGTEAEARQLLEPLLSVGRPTVVVTTGRWADLYSGFQIPSEQEPANWKFFSQYVAKPFPAEAISVIGSFMTRAPSPDSNYFVQPFGGVVPNSEPAGGSAYAHRDKLFYGEVGAGWGTRGGLSAHNDPVTVTAQAWIAEFSQALRPWVEGAYVNVPNVGMAEWEQAYWGSNVTRLREIKAKYDPTNVFKFEQSIPPA